MNQLRYHLYPSNALHADPHAVEVIVTEVGVPDAIVCDRASSGSGCRYEAFPRYPPGLLLEVDWETAARHIAGGRGKLPNPHDLAHLFDRHRSG
jgi:hypothetical protein